MEELAIKPSEPIGNASTVIEKNFNTSFLEYLWNLGDQIIAAKSSSGTIYTVPTGYTLYLTGAMVCLRNTAAVGDCSIEYNSTPLIETRCEAGGQSSNSISYPIPLKFNSNETIVLSAGGATTASICGFIVKNNLIPSF